MNIPNVYLPYRFYGLYPEVLEKKLLSDLSSCNAVKTDEMIVDEDRKKRRRRLKSMWET